MIAQFRLIYFVDLIAVIMTIDIENYGHLDAIYRPDIWWIQANRFVMQLYLFRAGYYMPEIFCLRCPVISWEMTFPTIPLQSLFDCPVNPCLWPLIDAVYYDPRTKLYYLFQGRWIFVYNHKTDTGGFDVGNTEKVFHFWNLNFHVRFATGLSQDSKELLFIGYNRTIIRSLQTAVMNFAENKLDNPKKDQHRIFESINFDRQIRDSTKFDVIAGLFTMDYENGRNYLWLIISHNDRIMVSVINNCKQKKIEFFFSSLFEASNLYIRCK